MARHDTADERGDCGDECMSPKEAETMKVERNVIHPLTLRFPDLADQEVSS
jgi:hypothetical protein